ncbi:hypothetical protein PRIPAC_70642 [Pristionchus pacificus]|uniref:Uncharacterized protein n=1 Tax=Pristionchus pacificus TaxID=54126 RepID=A0A2A6CGL8_PRIPA|nr:hypothetical protein PRIPAC_70642 [Pristionchus pacificus]|eukprot:PDM77230.1 hypothetical protein PRIPAC_43142 [Pristionchus pacificus]
MLHLTASGVDGSLATASLHAIGSPSDAIQSAVHVDIRGASIRLSVVRMGVDGVPSQVVEPTHRVSAAISLEITLRVRALHDAGAHHGNLTIAQAAAFLGSGDLPPILRPPPPPPRLSELLDYRRDEETGRAAIEFREYMTGKLTRHRNRLSIMEARKTEMVKKGEVPPSNQELLEVIRREEWEQREMEERMKNRTPKELDLWADYMKWVEKTGQKAVSDEVFFKRHDVQEMMAAEEEKERLAKAAEDEKERAMEAATEEVMEPAEEKEEEQEEEAMREKAKKRRAKEDGEEKEQNERMDTVEGAATRPVPLVAVRRLSPLPADLPADHQEHPGEEFDDSVDDDGPNEIPPDEQRVTVEIKDQKRERDQIKDQVIGIRSKIKDHVKLVEAKERERAERRTTDAIGDYARVVEEERDHMMEERDIARWEMQHAIDQLAQARAAALVAPPPPAAPAPAIPPAAAVVAVAPPPLAAAAAAAVVAAPIKAALAGDVAAIRLRMADYLGGGGLESKMLGRGDKSIDKDWHRIATTCANRHKRIRAAIESALPRLNQGLIQDPTKQRLLKRFIEKVSAFLDRFDGLVEMGEEYAKLVSDRGKAWDTVVSAHVGPIRRTGSKVKYVQAIHGVAFTAFEGQAKVDLPCLRAFEQICCSLPIPL